MKKILISIFLFNIFLLDISFADSGTSTITWTSSTGIRECGMSTSHGVTHQGVPNSNNATAGTVGGTINCTTHTYYTSGNYTITFPANNGGIRACAVGERVVAISPSPCISGTCTMTCSKFDDTPPTISDISNTVNTNLLATNNHPYSFSIGINGGAPITAIIGVRERYNNENIDLPYNCTSSPCNVSWDIRRVDNFRQANGGRQYTFRITQICDEAGNCWNGTQDYNHNIYANSQALINDATFTSAQKNIVTNQLSLINRADGTTRNLTIRLRDKFGNQIIPATGISRTIDFNWNVTNTMFLNQHSRTGAKSVYINRTTDPTNFVNNRLPGGNTSLNGETSTNGDYTYSFKVYTPTSNQDAIYGQVSDIDAQFIINTLNFDINGTIGATTSQTLNSWTPITAKFNPLYYTSISGEIANNGFIEGATQQSTISISKNGITPTTTERFQLSYGGTDSSKFNLYGGTGLSNVSTVGGTNIISRANIQSTNLVFPSSTNNFYSKLIQKPGSVGNTSNINLATHISYNITHPNGVGTINPIYNSYVLGKTSYHGTDILGGANQSGLKVLGQVSTSSENELLNNQFSSDVHIIGSVNKFFSKTQMVKNGYLFAKNVTGNTIAGSTITNINTHSNINDVIYFGAETGHGNKIYNLGNGSDLVINTNKTILVIGGNLYIRSNLYYTGNGMLGIIVLKDKDGNGGNIYVDPSVTNIVGTLFAEKSIVGYNGTIEIDGSTQVNILKNQLHIYGSLFSENTIGGSREIIPRCPYYITTGCTLELAQKYDLNYLRRYYLINSIEGVNTYKKPANNGKIIGGGTYSSAGNLTGGNALFARNITNTSDIYAPYSVLIEYNPKIQLTPPPLFTIEK